MSTEADARHVEHHVIRQPICELRGHVSPVIAADWMTDGSQVISASWDRTANLYSVETGDIIQTFTGASFLALPILRAHACCLSYVFHIAPDK